MNAYWICASLCICCVLLFIFRTYLPSSAKQINKHAHVLYTRALAHLVGKEYLKQISLLTTDSVPLNVYYLHNPNASKCIVYFHSSQNSLQNRCDTIGFLYNYASVITFDNRCEGLSGGNHLTAHRNYKQLDDIAVYRYALTTLGIKASNLVFFSEYDRCAPTLHSINELNKLDFHVSIAILHCPVPTNVTHVQKLVAMIGQLFNLCPPLLPRLKLVVACTSVHNLEWLNNKPDLIIHISKNFIQLSANDEYIYTLADLFKN